MRIGIDARFFGGEHSKGLGRYTQKLIEHLLHIDQRNQYVLFMQAETMAGWKPKASNIEIVLAPYRWYSLAEQIFMPLLIRKYKLDFIHFPHFNVPLIYRGPFIVTIHDLILHRFPTERATTLDPIKYKLKRLAYYRVMRHAALAARHIITVSEYSKQDIISEFPTVHNNISVTYEAVDSLVTADTTIDSVALLQQHTIQKPYLLYVGNAYPYKNLEILLQVIAKLKAQKKLSFQLVLVGKEDYFYKRLKHLAWVMDVDDAVVFTGFIADQDLPILYKEALAYIFPSKYEGFGLPPLEAMHYGTPVLASHAASLPEILGDAALYFDYQSVNDIIEQILKLQTNSVLRTDLITKGTEQVKLYNWERMARATLELYEKIFTKP